MPGISKKRESIDHKIHLMDLLLLIEDIYVAVKIIFYNDYDNFIANTKEIEFLNKLKKRDNIVEILGYATERKDNHFF